jgi:hypothetical protein
MKTSADIIAVATGSTTTTLDNIKWASTETVTGNTWTYSPIFEPSDYVIAINEGTEKHFELPKCAKCGTDVEMSQTSALNNLLTVVFTCHGEKRRIDISLKQFGGNADDARKYLAAQIDTLFNDEDIWQKFKPKTVKTPDLTKDAISRWLTN